MSSSTDNSDNISSRAECDMEDDSAEDTAAKQLTLQLENLSTIENEEGKIPNIMATTNNADIINSASTCAACGKEGEEVSMNICNKCKMVHYCNVTCKKKHKSKHKKKCERRATELHDEALFNEPPPREDCPICMMPLSLEGEESTFQACCGKIICNGCIYAMVMEDIKKGKELEEHLCAFCRTPETSSDEEKIRRREKLVENGNVVAIFQLGNNYTNGSYGLQQDRVKAAELWLKAGELGCAEAYCKLGCMYAIGQGRVERDNKKAIYYLELAAMMGNVQARHFLGCTEVKAGNHQRTYKHFIIAARAGHPESLDKVKKGFMDNHVSKDEFEQTLRVYHERQARMKSDARDAAADFVHSVEH